MANLNGSLYSTNVETRAIQYLFSDESTLGARFREMASIVAPEDIIEKMNDNPYRKFRAKDSVDQRLQYYLGMLRQKLNMILPQNWVLLFGSPDGEKLLVSLFSGDDVTDVEVEKVISSLSLEFALKKFEMKKIRYNRNQER